MLKYSRFLMTYEYPFFRGKEITPIKVWFRKQLGVCTLCGKPFKVKSELSAFGHVHALCEREIKSTLLFRSRSLMLDRVESGLSNGREIAELAVHTAKGSPKDKCWYVPSATHVRFQEMCFLNLHSLFHYRVYTLELSNYFSKSHHS